MLFPRLLICTLALAALLVAPAASADPAPDEALLELASYRVGQRLQARQACTIQGYAIKKDVILTVAAVHADDAGKVSAVDLTFSGMTIANVDVATVDKYFVPVGA
jgi:hypothetical protein